MAEIQTIPKRSRLNQQRPPLLPEPVDGDLLSRLDLPRYKPPKRSGRSRLQQRFHAQPLPDPPIEPKPGQQGKPEPKPQPLAQRTPGGLSEKQSSSPYGERPPINTALPPRRTVAPARPASDRQSPPGSVPPGVTPPGAGSFSGMRTNRDDVRGINRPPAVGAQTPAKTQPGARPGGSQLPPRNQKQPEYRAEPGETPDTSNQAPARPVSMRPPEPRRPFGASRPAGSRPESEPATPRPFRLPPLDFSPSKSNSAPDALNQQAQNRPEPGRDACGLERADVHDQHEPRTETPAVPAFQPFDEAPSLRDVLLNTTGMPAHTAVLGVCEDQLPVLLDLNNPAPGSLLVISDERQQELDLLRVAVISVALRNTARGAQFLVFSHLPEAWNQWVAEQGLQRYCLGVVGAETNQAREWIYRLSDWAEQREVEQREGPPVLVLFDTLSFMTRLSADARERLDTVIREGPQVRLWALAAVSTALASSLSRQLDGFSTWLWGYSEDSGFYTRMVGLSAVEARSFGAPGQFAVRVGPPGDRAWLKFGLPTLDNL